MAHDTSLKNLIFDLGGVILDLSVDDTLQSFSAISGIDKKKVAEIFQSAPGFEAYEKGMLNDNEFRDFVRSTYSISATDAELDACWNAMLKGIPITKLQLLERLMENYNVYLLSNTNTIHLHYINGTMLPAITGGTSLDPYFHKTYYSHLMKKRKPDAEIFQQVLEENNLRPQETLFLDDNVHNVEGAKALGIRTLHVVTPDLIIDYFHA
ncbi:MAG TPA: HAD family phosphatase [Ohtaekwangia sp.]|nr:HAD family phosphatase [Ohtaekwangia sp.]